MICYAFCKNGVNLVKIQRAKIIIFTKKQPKNGQKLRQKTRSKRKMSKNGNHQNAKFEFFTKNAPKNTTFKTPDRRILGQGSTKMSIKTTGHSLGSTTTFCPFFGEF